MKLKNLLERIDYTVLRGDLDREISEITNNSKKVAKDSLFICIKGAKFDGHSVASEVVAAGAACIVAEADVDIPDDMDVTVIHVESTRYAMAFIAAAWHGYPADSLKVIGITGTKGKTTTTYLTKYILEQAGHKVGLIGTIEAIIGDEHIPADNTTPESTLIQEYFARMKAAGCDVVVMEASSQGLMMHRSQGFTFEMGIFTNLEPDHIGPNEHKDFDDYRRCKGMLFKQCRYALANGDDENFKAVFEGSTCETLTFGLNEGNDIRAVDLKYITENGELGTAFTVEGLVNMKTKVGSPGKFCVYNALCAIAICRHFGVDEACVNKALENAKVKGRLETVKVSDDFTMMIDYAHNAMALESLLTTLREYHPNRLVCMFGCGGNRSKLRRYDMGEVSGRLADLTVITSDNPRDEEPQAIIDDIKIGMAKTTGKFIEICDRREAIAWCIHNGQPGDIIVLAGKGHEDYQEIKGKKYPMDERVIIQEILESDKK